MKPNPVFVAAAGFAMLGACTVKTEDNATEAVDSNSTPNANENAGPEHSGVGETDTLGNQLNQLNDSDAAADDGAPNSVD